MQKEAQEEQFKLCPEAYLRKHHVLTYLEDALTQLSLQEQPPRSAADSARFVADYFSSVMNGTHILFRDFSFIISTPFNRICFLKSVQRTYKALLQYSQSLSIQEMHSLLLLLCNDLPIELVQRAVLNSGHTLMNPILFSTFLQAFHLQFYMDEFLADAIKLYRTLQASKNSVVNSPVVSTGTDDQAALTPRRGQNVVVVPGPNDSDNFADVSASAESEEAADTTPVAIAARTTSTSGGSTWDYVETFAFRDRLKQAVSVSKSHQPHPTVQTVDECLSSSEAGPRIKFYQFFQRLASSSQVKNLFNLPENTNVSTTKETSTKKKFTVINSD